MTYKTSLRSKNFMHCAIRDIFVFIVFPIQNYLKVTFFKTLIDEHNSWIWFHQILLLEHHFLFGTITCQHDFRAVPEKHTFILFICNMQKNICWTFLCCYSNKSNCNQAYQSNYLLFHSFHSTCIETYKNSNNNRHIFKKFWKSIRFNLVEQDSDYAWLARKLIAKENFVTDK